MRALGSIGRSPGRRGRRAAASALLAVWFVALFPIAARADDCPITDLNCTVGTVDDTIGAVTGAGDDTTKQAKDAVDDTTTKVTDAVSGVTGGTHEDPPPVDGGKDHGGNPGATGSGGSSRNHGVAGRGFAAAASTATREAGTAVTTSPLTLREAASPRRPSDDAATARRIRAVATGIAVALLVMIGAALAFVAVQNRMDRRDPKLLLAPVTEELVTFG